MDDLQFPAGRISSMIPRDKYHHPVFGEDVPILPSNDVAVPDTQYLGRAGRLPSGDVHYERPLCLVDAE